MFKRLFISAASSPYTNNRQEKMSNRELLAHCGFVWCQFHATRHQV